MPIYSFFNKKTKKHFDKVLKVSELGGYLKKKRNLVQEITSIPAIGDSFRLGIHQPSDGFKDLLKNVKKRVGLTNSRYV